MSSVSTDMDDPPVLAGIDAEVATRRGSHIRRPTEKAAASRPPESPETFASRMKDHFTLHGPQEGGSTTVTHNIPENIPVNTEDRAENTVTNVSGDTVRRLH
jgi:hypothetical protein